MKDFLFGWLWRTKLEQTGFDDIAKFICFVLFVLVMGVCILLLGDKNK